MAASSVDNDTCLEDDPKDNTSWFQNLESVLRCSNDISDILLVTKGKEIPETLRSHVWQVCLEVKGVKDGVVIEEIFDLPEQDVLRKDCYNLVDKLGNDDEDKLSVVSDLESILTYFCKSKNVKYEAENGWLEILAPLLALKLTRTELYYCFNAILMKYIPRNCSGNAQIFHVFRLLILYHDPEICSFLDTKKISPGDFAISWFRSLFAVNCGLNVIHVMWDVYFQQSDPLFIFFLALVILVNTKDRLLAMSMESKETITDMLVSLPGDLEAADIEDFCSLALYYYMRTPTSYKKNCDHLFANDVSENGNCVISQALCLPVFAEELIYSAKHGSDGDGMESVRFFLVDCRPAEQYNSGHLPTAFHLDANLMLLEPQSFNTAVQALFSAQKQAIAANSLAGGEHLCFMGSGREEEDQYVHMVIASFLQKHRMYVSIAEGGYIALHSLLQPNLSNGLTDHSSKSCLVCKQMVLENGANGKEDEHFHKSSSIIEKLSLAVKSKSVEMKEKMVELITNPQQQAIDRHVSSSDKVGKRYRNMASVFTIDDDHEEGDGDAQIEEPEVVSISTWLKKPDVEASYRCQVRVNENLLSPCYLLVTETHMFVLCDIPNRRDHSHITSRRALSSIVKITSKKKCPDLITFKYGTVDGQAISVVDVDVFLIPKASEATAFIKQKIMKLSD